MCNQIISLLFIMLMQTSCIAKNKMEEQKFEWRPAESAPEHYAAEIYHGSIITEGNKYHSIPNGRTINHGWGTFGTTWDVGDAFKPVPNRLEVIWWSYAENQFYYLETDLPKEKMTPLFKKGYINDDGQLDHFSEINVGLAPGGAVSVWLLSASYMIEVGHYQAKKTEVDMKDFNPDGTQDKKYYLNRRAKRYSEETKQILATQAIPFGKWTAFRQRFFWKPVIKHDEKFKLDRLFCHFYNGEKYIVSDKNKALGENYNYPPANKIAFHYTDKNNNRHGCRVFFDEIEIWDAFKTLLKQPNEKPAELVLTIDKYNGNIKITLETETESIEIKKAKIKIYDISD